MKKKIGPGLWRQRNGVIVEVTDDTTLHFTGPNGHGGYRVWLGTCLCHREKRNWNDDGTYGAVGKHDFDLVAKVKEGATRGHRKAARTSSRLPAS